MLLYVLLDVGGLRKIFSKIVAVIRLVSYWWSCTGWLVVIFGLAVQRCELALRIGLLSA